MSSTTQEQLERSHTAVATTVGYISIVLAQGSGLSRSTLLEMADLLDESANILREVAKPTKEENSHDSASDATTRVRSTRKRSKRTR